MPRGILFLRMPLKMLSLLLSLLQLTELKIWAKMKVLNTSVVTTKLFFSVWSKPRVVWLRKWKMRMMMTNCGRVRSKGESGKHIHDDVNPE